MTNRWKGNFIINTEPTSSGTDFTGKANGVWSLNNQLHQKQAALWAKGQTIPNAPVITSADIAGDGIVSVVFTPPNSNGSNIIQYTVTGSRGSITTGTGSPITVSGLDKTLDYTFTMIATNGIGNSPVSNTSNSVIPVVVDQYSSYNILKLEGGGAEGSATFTDLSPVATTVTAYGNVHVDTTIKYSGTGSIAFDGAGDYLTIPNNTYTTFGTGDFTFEMRLYPLKALSATTAIVGNRMQSGSNGYSFLLYTEYGNLNVGVNGYSTPLVATNPLTQNTWHHVAVTRNGNTLRLYVNGAKLAEATYTGSIGGNDQLWSIGSLLGSSIDFQGNMDNIRFTKGIARYTTNSFTPVY